MKTLDPRIKAGPFLGKYMIFAPTSVKNNQRIRELTAELQELGEFTREYRKKINEVSESDLSDEEKQQKIDELTEELSEKSEQYNDDIVEYRKKIFDVMVDEWEDGEPDDDWYASEDFDDFMLFRVVDFFLRPVKMDLTEKN